MIRVCMPELLDSLPHDHPDAIHNRRDLRIINRLMGNKAWFARTLPGLMQSGERVLELGAGMGEMGMGLIESGIPVDGLDLWPRPPSWPSGREWHQADLMKFDGYDAYPVIIANLILHQFKAEELAALGERLRKSARVIVTCEPTRRRISQALTAVMGPIFGANHVTLHDSKVSIAAGFLGDELPDFLGLEPGTWRRSYTNTSMGVIRTIAIRSP
jgi:hypothetical protein